MTGAEVRHKRVKLGLNQAYFWNPLGLSQSAGSRYEGGRDIPSSIQNLLVIAYGSTRECEQVVAILRKYK